MGRIVSVKVEQEVVYSVSNDYAADDLGWTIIPQTTPISTFCVVYHIFVVGEHRNFKFGTQVDRS